MTEKEKITLEKARKIAAVLDSKKAKNVKILYVRCQTVLADYFVIANTDNSTHVKALCDEVDFQLGEVGFPCTSVQGKDGTNWIVMDYDDILVHIFHTDLRKYYNLDKLWQDGQEIPLEGDVVLCDEEQNKTE